MSESNKYNLVDVSDAGEDPKVPLTEFEKLENKFTDMAFKHMGDVARQDVTDLLVAMTQATLTGRVPWHYRIHCSGGSDYLLRGVQSNDRIGAFDQRPYGPDVATYVTAFNLPTVTCGVHSITGVRIVVPDTQDGSASDNAPPRPAPPFDFAVDVFNTQPQHALQTRIPFKYKVDQDALTGLVNAARMSWCQIYETIQKDALAQRRYAVNDLAILTTHFQLLTDGIKVDQNV